ncbi:hypothetical protein CALCODRAFT_504295 [Calocera cornea HHB12733]|uniref:MFS general substrate transporter n=1 Tax=Calocera cornea HHB12733 TaxID=1353952 RepID=A0A165CHE4_9BASI|nr:hypothetical protein CALCODRAFT_504295 [Calocera cornea HHB12733]
MVGAIVIWKASWTPPGLPLFGYYLLPIFGAPYVLLLALASNNIAGGTKKAVATGAVFVGYNVGNIVGPYLVDTTQAPEKYRTMWISIIVVMCFTILSSLALRLMWARENRRRDALPPVASEEQEQEGREKVGEETGRTETDFGSTEGVMHVERDLTDWENGRFRYSL